MIAELTRHELPAELWGNKAARLSQAARLGFAVPPALCFQAGGLAGQATSAALSSWLACYRPKSVIVRTSSVREDIATSANAGRTVSVADCPPDVGAILSTVQQDILSTLPGWMGADNPGLCVMVQEQLDAAFAGVAFLIGSRLTVELSIGSTSTVTSGALPDLRLELPGTSVARAEGTAIGHVPVMAIGEALHRVCSGLREALDFEVDVEWAWSSGAISVLQVRPVTALLNIAGPGVLSWTS